jgi:2-iminobutanoate/2-iminopropanoate deaminase
VKVIETANAPHHTGPVPQAVESGGWIFVSALFGNDPETGGRPAEAREEADQVLANLAAILTAAGAGLSDVVRVGIFMRDLQRDRPAFNQAWVRHFGDHRPARSAVEVNDFGRAGEGARYMVEAQADRGEPPQKTASRGAQPYGPNSPRFRRKSGWASTTDTGTLCLASILSGAFMAR